MRMIDALKEAVELLSEVPDESFDDHTTWEARRAALLLAGIEDAEQPGPMTDQRWHEYAVAALRTCGPGCSDIQAAAFATGVADKMLEAAKNQALAGKGAA